MTNGIDISHFTESTSGPLTEEDMAMLKRRGVERVVVSIYDHAIARRQIETIAPHGIEIQTYRYYYWSTMREARLDDERFIAEMRNKGINIQFHWLDHEDTSVRRPVEQNEADIADMIDWWKGKCSTGIYTGAWWWNDYMAGSTRFSFMPLWFADYDWQETLVLDQPFGGWTKGVMKQTMGDFDLEGVWCDTDYYEKADPMPPQPPAESHKEKALDYIAAAQAAIEAARIEVEAITEAGK